MIDYEIGNEICADSLGFVVPHMEEPAVIDKQIGIDVAIVTSAPPMCLTNPGAPPSLAQTLAENKKFSDALLEQRDLVHLVRCRKDLEVPGFVRIIRGLQCPPGDADPWKAARQLWDAGIRVVNLSGYEEKHPFGAGFAMPGETLDDRGKEFIQACAWYGFIGDFAHMSFTCMRQALEYIDRENLSLPIMASHVGCWGVYQHYRNLPDDIIISIFERGGYVGIVGMTIFLSEDDDSDGPYFKHLDHALELARSVGRGYVGLGSDAVYRNWSMERAREHWSKLLARVAKDPANFNVADRLPPFPREWVENGLNLPRVIKKAMQKRGYSHETRRRVLGQNFVDFLKKALPA